MQPKAYLDTGFFQYTGPAGWVDGGRHVRVSDPSELLSALQALEAAQQQGAWVVMALAYEAGWYLMDLPRHLKPTQTADILLDAWIFETPPHTIAPATPSNDPLPQWQAPDKNAYVEALERVQAAIAAGVCYQINQTFQMTGHSATDPWQLYGALLEQQPADFGGFMHWPDRQILSRSPELFLTRQGSRIRSEPMKGTAARAESPQADQSILETLLNDPKMQAENLMIVDLIRNDLSRVAEPGSVKVPKLFESRPLKSVHQVSSVVEAQLQRGRGVVDVLRALFPCGSVVGAPKTKAFELIQQLETTPRGIYTGSLGLLQPSGDFTFSVAIRTLDQRADAVSLGLGSGVVADSDIESEWLECLLKGRFAGVGVERIV